MYHHFHSILYKLLSAGEGWGRKKIQISLGAYDYHCVAVNVNFLLFRPKQNQELIKYPQEWKKN